MSKLEDNKKAKKESLFHTSFELFTSKGFNNTSISDIVSKAGVAKGTFYLYFKDKYDIRNKLISYKANSLFEDAFAALEETQITDFTDSIIFIADHIIDKFTENTALLRFISKNLSWGVFTNALTHPLEKNSIDLYDTYLKMIDSAPYTFKNPEVMLFMIVELISSSCYSCILNNSPLPMVEYKPYLYDTIRGIISIQIVR